MEIDVEDKNVVLIVADTLTALHLPSYGYERDTAPFLTELAEENFLVKNAYSNAPWTVPSHASLFSGKLPSEHGMNTGNMVFQSNSFVEEIQSKGYHTVGVSANSLVSEDLNFDRGFDSFHEVFNVDTENSGSLLKLALEKLKSPDLETAKKGLKLLYNKAFGRSNRGADNIERIVKNEIKASTQPNFLFINYTEPHLPYTPPEEFAEKFTDNASEKISNNLNDHYETDKPEIYYQGFPNCTDQDLIDLYDAEIRYLDSKLENLYNYLNQELDDLIFIVTSDHGENFGEHGAYFHQCGIWEKSIRIPMIIAGDGVPDEQVKEAFSLRNLKYLIQDNELRTSKTVFAEYSSWKEMEDENEEREGKAREFADNTSQAAVQKNKALVQNSTLSNFQFIPDQKCCSKQKDCFENQEELETKMGLILGD